jgi:arginine N-succinyltransferase
MTYAEADRASKKNKEFIKGLFPEGAIYATLLPQDAQDVIGKVGTGTRGVEKMLRRIGFNYAWRVDPFDGGPHFTAPTDEVALVQKTHEARVSKLLAASEAPKTRALVAVETSEAPFFRCVYAPWKAGGDASGELVKDAAEHLGVAEGAKVWILPIE